MAVTTKKTFPATTNATTTVFSPVSIQLNNQDDLDVYVTLSGGTRVLQLRQSTGSTAQTSHPQVNNTDGLYFPAVSAGTTLYNYTLSSDNNTITFNSALPQGAVVFCERRTRDADSAYTSFASGSTIRATDLNNSSTESNFTAQDARNKALDLEGSIFGGIQPSIDGVAQPFVNSSKIIDGSIATADIANDAITEAKIANDALTGNNMAAGTITTAKIADNAITSAKIANSQITTAKLATNSVTADKIVSANVTTAKIADGAVASSKIADANVTTAKIADTAVATSKIANDAVTNSKIADNSIDSEHYVDGSIDTAHIANDAVTNAKIADDAVQGGQIATGAVGTTKIAIGAVNDDRLASNAVTSAKIASNAVTTDKIADGELTTLAGMQSTTASNLASSTALTATTAELNQLDGITLETTLTSSDTRIPTSKAVNDQILAVTNALGGFVAIANETSFPATNPDPSNGAGTVVSISQISSGSAISVNGSGVATITNGAGTGNTVTITGFPATLQNTNLAQNSGLQVQTTTTLHTYTFHKQLASADDIQAISATVNSFSNRYRVSASAPTSSLDGGDLWYDTTNSKLMVYSSQNSAWEESSAIGNFFISTISSSSNTGGGSATANGTAYRFTISNAPVSAQQLIVSVDGVIQKPNAGSSQPSEGFVLVGNDIIFGSAPANGASMFVTVIGSTVGIGTPSNNTVTTAILQNGSVTTAKITDSNVTTAKIADSNITTAKIADGAVTAAKLAGSITASLLSNNSVTTSKIADDAVTTAKIADSQVTTAKIADIAVTTAKLSNDSVTAAKIAANAVGSSELANDSVGTNALANTSVTAGSYGSSTSIPSITVDAQGRITAASGNSVNTDLVGDTSPQLGGNLDTNDKLIQFGDATGSNNYTGARFGDDDDLWIYHTPGNLSVIRQNTSGKTLTIQNSGGNTLVETLGEFRVQSWEGETIAKFIRNGACELYHDGSNKKFETTSAGAKVNGTTFEVADDGDVNLILNADTDNADESHNPAIQLRQDGGSTHLQIGIEGSAGTIYSNSGGNTSYILTLTNTNLHLGTNNSAKWQITTGGHFNPMVNNSYDIGSSSTRVRNIYTNDLHLSNEGHSNDVDGTWGDWTIQEGESDLFLKNNRSGKKYKFNLTEVS